MCHREGQYYYDDLKFSFKTDFKESLLNTFVFLRIALESVSQIHPGDCFKKCGQTK